MIRRPTLSAARTAAVTCAMIQWGCGGGGERAPPPVVASPPVAVTPPPSTSPEPLGSEPARCEDGSAGDFACSRISLAARVALDQMEGSAGNDIWGWADVETGQEYAIMG